MTTQLTIFGIILATGSILQPTPDLQSLLDNSSGLYVQDANYITAHSHLRLGKAIASLKPGRKFTFNNQKCTVISKTIVNYRTQHIEVLTGGDLYLQTCIDTPDLAYLLKAKCK